MVAPGVGDVQLGSRPPGEIRGGPRGEHRLFGAVRGQQYAVRPYDLVSVRVHLPLLSCSVAIDPSKSAPVSTSGSETTRPAGPPRAPGRGPRAASGPRAPGGAPVCGCAPWPARGRASRPISPADLPDASNPRISALPRRELRGVPVLYAPRSPRGGAMAGEPDQVAGHLQRLVRRLRVAHQADQVGSFLGRYGEAAHGDPTLSSRAGEDPHLVAVARASGPGEATAEHARTPKGGTVLTLAAQDLVAGLADHLLGEEPGERLRPGVPVDDVALGVYHEDGVRRDGAGHAFEDPGKSRHRGVVRLLSRARGELHNPTLPLAYHGLFAPLMMGQAGDRVVGRADHLCKGHRPTGA